MTLLQVQRLSKAFGAVRAVEDVSFEVRAGEIYGLLGPNGAGKTTTISMVCGLLKPDAGSLEVDGHSFWGDPQRAKRVMGVVPQEVAVYEELTARENLEFWGRTAGLRAVEARARAGELLETLSLADRARDRVKTYSGGMKRRVNLAVPCCTGRGCCCWTNQPSALIRRRGRRSSNSSAAWPPPARPSCTRRITSTRPRRCVSGSASLTRGGCWPKARSRNCASGSAATVCMCSKGICPALAPTRGLVSATGSASSRSPGPSLSRPPSVGGTRATACGSAGPAGEGRERDRETPEPERRVPPAHGRELRE